jgi:ketosteroid isomerase-like protein
MPEKELQALAQRLVDLCRAQQEATALAELYDPAIVSVEAMPMPGQASREIHGLEALRQKHAWWNGAFEVHGGSVDGPYPHGEDRFAAIFEIDATDRESGERSVMREVAVYHVKGGKIVREEFFYG